MLTGTPIQNNLRELYSLLSLIQPSIFAADDTDNFVNSYSNVQNHPALGINASLICNTVWIRLLRSSPQFMPLSTLTLLFPAAELQSILEPFLLRRVKSEVAVDLPKKTELVVYHGMSALQKKYYKAVLTKDLGEAPLVL